MTASTHSGERNNGERKRAGRPTSFQPEYCRIAEELCAAGATDKKLAETFGVTEQTVNNWKDQFPEFFESLKRGKALADDEVERSLFLRATGYSVPEVHISNYQGQVTKTPIIKHYPPDPTSMIFWLKNRRKEQWREKVVHSNDPDNPMPTPVVATDYEALRKALARE